jgi:hypothetical protein
VPATISLPKPDATKPEPPPPPREKKSGFQGTQRAAETTSTGNNNSTPGSAGAQANNSRGKARGGLSSKFDLGAELMAAQGASGRSGFVAPCRQACACQAVEHALVGNCRSCGKIICVQEGLGPCSFCGVEYTGKLGAKPPPPPPVADSVAEAAHAQQVGEHDDADKDAAVDAATAKAIEAKDRLVHFDRTSMQRTTVIDDQSDYFSIDTNQWLTDEERANLKREEAEAKAAEEARKKRVTVTFDLVGRKVNRQKERVCVCVWHSTLHSLARRPEDRQTAPLTA